MNREKEFKPTKRGHLQVSPHTIACSAITCASCYFCLLLSFLEPETYQMDPRFFTQQPSDGWLEGKFNNEGADDSILVYSASDLESWRPLSPEVQASFEDWTDFSWSPPINLPSWASFLQSVRRPLESSAWHQCIGTQPPPSPKLKSRFQRPVFDIQEAEHEFQNGETAVSIAFREIEESERAGLFEHPIRASDEILYFQFGEDMPMCVSD